jgi:hypothetical protein
MKPQHIIDSGAFHFFNLHNSRFNRFCNKERQHQSKNTRPDFSYAKTDEFRSYVDQYADFVKKWAGGLDGYITVDCVLNPKLSWKVHRYLEEEHGLRPIPVIHFGTSEKWLEKYLDKGYDYIGLGGRIGRSPYFPWADKLWSIICDTPNRLPVCKVHGFAITTHRHMTRYPWYSVDSTAWKKFGYFGQILIPPKRNGDFSWTDPNLIVFIDMISPYTKRRGDTGRHFLHYRKQEQDLILEWLDHIKVPFGQRDEQGRITRLGVSNCKQERCAANIRYFQWLQNQLPEWPWPLSEEVGVKPSLLELLK